MSSSLDQPAGAPAIGRPRVNAARLAVLLVFALNGATFATWASRIPNVRDELGLAPGQLGLLLLFISAGSLIALPLSGRVTPAIGAQAAVRYGSMIGCFGMVLAGFATDLLRAPVVVAVGMFLIGLGIGFWDVSMNLEGATVEHLWGKTVMPHFHAAFSLGTVVSALIGAGMAKLEVSVSWHLLVGAILIVVTNFLAAAKFLPRGVEAAEEAAAAEQAEAVEAAAPVAARSAWTEPRTLLVGLVTMVAAFTEGTANDWMSVALVDGYHLPAWAGVLGFATFLTFMTLGRVSCVKLLDRYGRVPTLRVLFLLAMAGSLLVIFGTTPLAFIGAAIWGFGVSLGFPVGMSAAADEPARAAQRLSVVATIAYTAFLAGPPLLGFLGDHVGVLRAFLVVSAALVPALLLLPVMRERAALTANTDTTRE